MDDCLFKVHVHYRRDIMFYEEILSERELTNWQVHHKLSPLSKLSLKCTWFIYKIKYTQQQQQQFVIYTG